MFSAISSFQAIKNGREPFLTLRSNGQKGGRQGWQVIKKPGVMAGQTLIAKGAVPAYRAATTMISTSTSGLYIFASTQARAGAAPGATQASQT